MSINDPTDPQLRRIHQRRLHQRDIDQLLGICEFALQDGHIDQSEAEAILEWLNNHQGCLDIWPANVLYDQLRTVLADGILDPDEQRDTLSLIMSITRPPAPDGHTAPASLPLCAPPPSVSFANSSFCFTGVFDFGPRAACQIATERAGGIIAKGITKKLNYLVIGNVGSECWLHSSFGTKIIKAVEYRDEGHPIHIISEDLWVTSLP